jgi:hypothetical protein
LFVKAIEEIFLQNKRMRISKAKHCSSCPHAHAHKQYGFFHHSSRRAKKNSNGEALYHFEAKKAIKNVLLRPIIFNVSGKRK